MRIGDNLALDYARRAAARRGLPLLVVFGLTPGYPGAAARAYAFLLDGLRDAAARLADEGIPFIVRSAPPPEAALEFADRAALTVTDMGYTRIQRRWRRELAERIPGPAIMVEDNVSVPAAHLYPKAAVGARVLRPRIQAALEDFLNDGVEPEGGTPAGLEAPPAPIFDPADAVLPDPADLAAEAGRAAPPVKGRRGGETAAEAALERFINGPIHRYDEDRNDPVLRGTSGLSPFLHFGQISVREAARRAKTVGGPGAEAFLEELLVRRELAVNFAWYHPNCDDPEVLPGWARESLDAHGSDPRPVLYEPAVMEAGETYDPYWNACQKEMVHTGTMAGYMRMYWGKKVIEWSADWRRAWALLVEWNDRYELDGRDPNGYAGVAWCFGMHDRPWKTRAVFGSIRYMNDKGLKRKFDADAYVRDVEERIRIPQPDGSTGRTEPG